MFLCKWTLQESEPTIPDPNDQCVLEPLNPATYSFQKIVTASDISNHGGFSVLKKHATECFPPLVLIFIFIFSMLLVNCLFVFLLAVFHIHGLFHFIRTWTKNLQLRNLLPKIFMGMSGNLGTYLEVFVLPLIYSFICD